MKNCNHLLGYVHTYDRPHWIRAKFAAAELEAVAISAKAVREQMAELKIMGMPKRTKETIEAVDYLDRRQSMAHLFHYCPDCGEKLAKIIAKIKSELQKGQA